MDELLKILQKLKAKEIFVLLSFIASLTYGGIQVYDAVESRYAKLDETRKAIAEQKRELDIMTQGLHTAHQQFTELLYTLPKDKREEIEAKLKTIKNLKPNAENRLQ